MDCIWSRRKNPHGLQNVSEKKSTPTFSSQWAKRRRQASTKSFGNGFGEDVEIVSEKKSTFSGQWAKRRRQASTKWFAKRLGEKIHKEFHVIELQKMINIV